MCCYIESHQSKNIKEIVVELKELVMCGYIRKSWKLRDILEDFLYG